MVFGRARELESTTPYASRRMKGELSRYLNDFKSQSSVAVSLHRFSSAVSFIPR